ncbi:MAG: hypothetical protein IPJ94_07880 [Chloroflexi bacterium]|nr:hypothetical protein [Chloroflexota bacterium]
MGVDLGEREMGKRPFIVLLVFCLLWLAACGADAPEVLPTATAVPPQPTATATTPPTVLPSATRGGGNGRFHSNTNFHDYYPRAYSVAI